MWIKQQLWTLLQISNSKTVYNTRVNRLCAVWMVGWRGEDIIIINYSSILWAACIGAFSWMRLTNSCFSRHPRHSSPHEAKMFLSSNTLSLLSPSLLRSFSWGSADHRETQTEALCRVHTHKNECMYWNTLYRIWADRSACLSCWGAGRSSQRGRGRTEVGTRMLWRGLLHRCWLRGSNTRTKHTFDHGRFWNGRSSGSKTTWLGLGAKIKYCRRK